MCEFHESTCNGFGDIWWTDNPIYFSSIDRYHDTNLMWIVHAQGSAVCSAAASILSTSMTKYVNNLNTITIFFNVASS